ncbi:MAG: hypothetical protein PHD25_08445 [Bacteroidales bacterium]|nr:hypothetical protein [Bacteroidales bacterium]
MKTFMIIVLTVLSFHAGFGQNATVVLVKHELRWTDETRFPNYFLDPEVRDSIFDDTRVELMNYLNLNEVAFPEDIEYRIIDGFGKQKVEMPATDPGADPQIAIFSFITRGTSNFAMYWHLNILINESGKRIVTKNASHELEYYDASGYFSPRCWLSDVEFRSIFSQLVRETLGTQPASDEKILLGSPEKKEELVRSLFPDSQRALLKIRGAWRNAGNFSALIELGTDTLVRMNYRQGWESEYSIPTFSALFATLFTTMTGLDIAYEQKVVREVRGSMLLSDGRKIRTRFKWLEIKECTVMEGVNSVRVTAPMVAEIVEKGQLTGKFVCTQRSLVHASDRTREKFSLLTGFRSTNTFGTEQVYRVDGYMGETPVFAEFNEYHGITAVSADTSLQAMMVVQNCNPDNRTFGSSGMSKSKKVSYGASTSIGKPSLDNAEKTEWYPVYLPENVSREEGETCLKILSCLFFGIWDKE